MTMADQIDFTLKAELLLFVWPAWCVRAASKRAFDPLLIETD